MSDAGLPPDPDGALNLPARPPYEPPSLADYGTLEDLTRGAFGPSGDDLATGTQP